jgi:hypothetical protein
LILQYWTAYVVLFATIHQTCQQQVFVFSEWGRPLLNTKEAGQLKLETEEQAVRGAIRNPERGSKQPPGNTIPLSFGDKTSFLS